MAFRASNISGSGISGAVAKKSSPSPPAAQLAAAAAIMTATQHQKDGRRFDHYKISCTLLHSLRFHLEDGVQLFGTL